MIVARSAAALGILILLGCTGSASDAPAVGAVTAPSGVTFTVVPAKPSFGPTEPVAATLRIDNGSADTVRFEFRTGCQVWFEITADTVVRFHSRTHLFCTQALTTLPVAPGATASLPFTWDRHDDAGTPVPPGHYRITAFLADGNSPPVSATIELR